MGKLRWKVGWGVAFPTKNDTLAWDSCQGAFTGFEPENNLTRLVIESHPLNNSVKDTQGSEYVIVKEDCEAVLG